MLAPSHPLQLVLGLVIWSLWFVAWYGGLSVACELAPPPETQGPFTWLNLLLLLASVLTVLPLLYWARRCWRASTATEAPGANVPTANTEQTQSRGSRLVARVAAGVHLFAAGAIVVMVLPALVLPPCV